MTAPPKLTIRMRITATNFADAKGAMRLANLIAETSTVTISGIMVEETLASEVAYFPSAGIVTSHGVVMQMPTRQQVRNQIESDALAFQKSLAKLAKTHAAEWNFERRAGDLNRNILSDAADWDLLLLGYRDVHRLRGQVVLVSTDSGADVDAFATSLAQRLGVNLVTVAVANGADAQDDLLATLDRLNASVLILGTTAGALLSHAQLEGLLDAARCPVLVVGQTPDEPIQ